MTLKINLFFFLNLCFPSFLLSFSSIGNAFHVLKQNISAHSALFPLMMLVI